MQIRCSWFLGLITMTSPVVAAEYKRAFPVSCDRRLEFSRGCYEPDLGSIRQVVLDWRLVSPCTTTK